MAPWRLLALLAAGLALSAASTVPAGLGRFGACGPAGGWSGRPAGALRLRGGAVAAPTTPPPDPQAVLLAAAHAGKMDEVVEAVQAGADPNRFCDPADNMLEPNALQYACFEGRTKVVEKLVELGAVVNMANKRGYTALHFAALMGHLETCKALVRLGADLGATDTFGDRPVDRAEQAEKPAVVKWLREQMDAKGLPPTEEQQEDAENQELIDDGERMMLEEDFIPRFMMGPDGEILPEYSSIAELVAAKKALMGPEGEDLDFEAIQELVERTTREVEGYDPNQSEALEQEQLRQMQAEPAEEE